MVKRLMLLIVFGVLTIAVNIAPVYALNYTESFNGSSLNSMWWASSASNGNTLGVSGGQLVMTQSSSAGSGSITFNYQLTGDFVVSVDYTLLNWAPNNYERIGLSASGIGPVERSQHPGWFDEAYLTHFSDGVITVATSDLNGKMRLTRVGSLISGYYWNGSDWILIHSYALASTDVTTISLAIWNGYADNSNNPVRIAFDNFTISAPSTTGPVEGVPEPATLLLLGLGLVGLAGVGRKIQQK